MSNITFLYSWSSDNTTAWSGTPNGLLSALKKRADIRTLQVASCPKTRIGAAARSLLSPKKEYRAARKILNVDSAQHPNDRYLCFGEYRSQATGQTYCYQDLSADFLYRQLRKKDGGYAYLSAFERILFGWSLGAKRKNARKFYRDCGGVFTMSRWLKEDFVNHTEIPADKVHYVGGGCSLDPALIDDSFKCGNKFLFVGKSWERKNGDLVVAAFQELQKRVHKKNIELYIAGPTKAPKSIKGQQGITFLGNLSQRELADWYNTCDYFVMPSNFEAYGLVFLEALTFGLPCIGKNCFAMPEFIKSGKNGYLIEKNDAAQLADAMEKLLQNGGKMAAHLKENREYYLKIYSWDRVAERILSVLNP